MEQHFSNNHGKDLQNVNHSMKILNKSNPPTLDYISPKEVWEIIRRLSCAKASGHDKISYNALRHLPKITITLLENIYTECLQNVYFPTELKICPHHNDTKA